MPIPSVPDFLKNVICHSGNTFPIPENTGSGTGDLSYAQGWPALTSLPISAGGIAPRREYFNAVYQLLSKHIFFMQSGGVYPWNPSLNYLVNCHVQGSDGKEYIALRPSGPDTPGETGFVGPVDPVTDTTRVWSTSASSGGGGAVLLGTVTAFSGNFGGPGNRYPIPLLETQPNQDWVLCDGVQTNGLTVPDLRGRMILGTSSQYPRGSVGGAYNHTHTLSGTVGDTTLTVDQLAEHTHADMGYNYTCAYGSHCEDFLQPNKHQNGGYKYMTGSNASGPYR